MYVLTRFDISSDKIYSGKVLLVKIAHGKASSSDRRNLVIAYPRVYSGKHTLGNYR